jgi:hypothetical protein
LKKKRIGMEKNGKAGKWEKILRHLADWDPYSEILSADYFAWS